MKMERNDQWPTVVNLLIVAAADLALIVALALLLAALGGCVLTLDGEQFAATGSVVRKPSESNSSVPPLPPSIPPSVITASPFRTGY